MFGVVPRPLWETQSPPDDRNRILLAMRPLLVEADWGRMIIDCGVGDKMDAKQRDIYAVDSRPGTWTRRWRAWDSTADRIDVVLATHLHFDHFGGATVRRGGAARAALSARPLRHPRRPSGKTRRILTSAIEPATCRTTSSR